MTTGSIDLSDAGQNRVAEVQCATRVDIANECITSSDEGIHSICKSVHSNDRTDLRCDGLIESAPTNKCVEAIRRACE